MVLLKVGGNELELFLDDGSLYYGPDGVEDGVFLEGTPKQKQACIEFHDDLSGLLKRFTSKMI